MTARFKPELARHLLRGDHRRRRAVDVGAAHQLGVGVRDHLRRHHLFERRLHLIPRLRVHGGVMVVLDRHLGELLEGGAVLAGVLEPGLGEDAGHGAGAEQAFGRDARLARPAQEPGARHLLDADREHQVVEPGLDRDPTLAERGGAGGARVGAVDHRNAGEADLAQDALAHHAAREHEVAAVERLHVADGEPGVVERAERRLGAQRLDRAIGELPELDHVDADDVDVAAHCLFSSSAEAGSRRSGTRCLRDPCAARSRRSPRPACRAGSDRDRARCS